MLDIESREDVRRLIETFYGTIRKEAVLGPIFNGMVKDWTEHTETLTDFWETNLFFKPVYKGKPIEVHQEVDAHTKGTLTKADFDRWLTIWNETVDKLFSGEKASLAKYRAGNIANMMYIKIVSVRSER